MAKGFGPKKAPQTTKRQTAYFKLIQALLKCPRGKELKILRKHPDLVDVGLVEMMEMVATILVGQREFYSAEFLIDLADFLYSSYIETDGSPVTGSFVKAPAFLWEVLRTILLNPSDQQTVYQLLATNSDELNEYFWLQFCLWIDYTLLKCEPKTKKGVALGIVYFSEILWLFPLGNRIINLEIAIAGFEGSAKILTREILPEMWVKIQSDLAPAYRHRRLGDRSENLEKALTACTNALQISTRDTYPQEWAMVQNNLGLVYSDRIIGDESENLEKAIACYEGALQVVSRDRTPELWGRLQNNLAVVYTRRVEGDRSQNFEKAIACYQVALKVRTDADWASSQWHLGTAYSQRILGDKTQNLERAIAAYQAALQIYTPETYPERWANTQSDLGKAYRKLGQIANALTCFEAALTIFTPDSFPRECIATGLELGKVALATGKKAEAFRCFARVIEAVEMIARWSNSESLHQEIPEKNYAYLQIVTLCLACGEREKAREYANRSASPLIVDLLQDVEIQQITSLGQFLDRALQTAIESETNPQAFYQLIEENLEQLNDSLVERFNDLKLILSEKLLLSELGSAEEINLAAAILKFSSLIQHFDKGDEENNWKIAKAGYEVAAAVFTQEKFPEQWEAIQQETRQRLLFQLFKALNESQRNFPTVDRLVETNSNRLDAPDRLVETNAERIDKHFFTGLPEVNLVLEANQAQLDEHFIKVLRDWSSAMLSEVQPEEKKALASSIIALSLCIREFKQGNQANNLEIAIAGYEIAATVLTRESTPEGWADCQMFVGNAYHRRFKGDWAENQERSIACCQNALQVYTRESFPERWAAIQNTLALAYGNRIRGDRLENAELARTACFAAMEVRTREANPAAWAQLQNNLGIIPLLQNYATVANADRI